MNEEELNESLIELLKKGLITVEYTDDLEAVFSITKRGEHVVETLYKDLKSFNEDF